VRLRFYGAGHVPLKNPLITNQPSGLLPKGVHGLSFLQVVQLHLPAGPRPVGAVRSDPLIWNSSVRERCTVHLP